MNAQKFNDLLKRMKYDKNAVEEFYNAFYLTIKAHVKYRFGYLADPEDMAQDIFMKLYTMETPSYVKAPAKWLGKFSDNFVIDQLRASRPELGLLESHPSDFDLEKTIVKFDLKNAMSHLDEVAQKIIYMNYWESYSLKDVAVILNMSYGNVRQIACRAYKKLKLYLKS
jgi:RNA polymerase sigma factor (sigma-70 family)